MNRIKGILYAAVSSSTFGLAPFLTITLLLAGFSAFEVLSYRWGVASIVLIVFGWLSILGAMEPLTAVVIGVFVFKELFTVNSAVGIILILLAVSIVVFRRQKS